MVERIKLFRIHFYSGFFLLLTLFCIVEAGYSFQEYNKLLLFSLCIFADVLTVLMKTAYSQRLSFSPVHLAIFSTFKNRS